MTAQQSKADAGKRVGGTVVGGAKGAAAGAAMGAVAGGGKGAATGAKVGAVAGGILGRRDAIYGEEVEAKRERNGYQRAFRACMEARGYTVK